MKSDMNGTFTLDILLNDFKQYCIFVKGYTDLMSGALLLGLKDELFSWQKQIELISLSNPDLDVETLTTFVNRFETALAQAAQYEFDKEEDYRKFEFDYIRKLYGIWK